jgi:hypothetical protein
VWQSSLRHVGRTKERELDCSRQVVETGPPDRPSEPAGRYAAIITSLGLRPKTVIDVGVARERRELCEEFSWANILLIKSWDGEYEPLCNESVLTITRFRASHEYATTEQ